MAGKMRSLWNRVAGQRDISCFISYSHEDGANYARQLSQHLQEYGVRILLPDTEISAGTRWVDDLQNLMNHADVLILVGTQGAFASQWVLHEVQYFRGQCGVKGPG